MFDLTLMSCYELHNKSLPIIDIGINLKIWRSQLF